MHFAHRDISNQSASEHDGDHEQHNRGLPSVGQIVSAVTNDPQPSLEPLHTSSPPSSHDSTHSALDGPTSSPKTNSPPPTSIIQPPSSTRGLPVCSILSSPTT